MQLDGPALDVYRVQAGAALKIVRMAQGMNHDRYREEVLPRVWGREVSRTHLINLEKGRRSLEAAELLALIDDAGMDVSEVLSAALHEYLHSWERTVIEAHRAAGRQRLEGDPGSRDRVAEIGANLRRLHEMQQSRPADATEHPPIE